MKKQPLFLEPRIVPRVWGGDRLAAEFGRTLPDEAVGESWEVHGELRVLGTQESLDQMVNRLGQDLLGTRVDPAAGFPLLTKWLDCRDWLSVQVHPDDDLAREFTGDPEARGKTEAWYVHRASEEAELIHGLAEGVKAEQLSVAQGEEFLPLLRRFHPHPGQLLFTAAGVVHALGPGALIFEVQQSCDMTYRFYDWGREREIHPERAAECVKRSKPTEAELADDRITCPFFDFEVLRALEAWEVGEESFQILATTQTGARLAWKDGEASLGAGQSVLLPAGLGAVELQGEMKEPCLRVRVPQ